ncbi:hypothetical protein [Kibdelosporangium philippinense]
MIHLDRGYVASATWVVVPETVSVPRHSANVPMTLDQHGFRRDRSKVLVHPDAVERYVFHRDVATLSIPSDRGDGLCHFGSDLRR